jgi:hypothetical protein
MRADGPPPVPPGPPPTGAALGADLDDLEAASEFSEETEELLGADLGGGVEADEDSE